MIYPRTFRIDRGIGQYDFNDYYAVLGLPLTAETSVVRKRYLMIAKCLHPDVHGRSSEEKEVATLYLSKLVNPAYDVMSQERERTEYSAILKLLGKRLMKRNQKFLPHSDLAKQYLHTSEDINYEQTVKDVAKVQYHDLNQALENICLLSELNLVHILLQEGYRPQPQQITRTSDETVIQVSTNATAYRANASSTTKPNTPQGNNKVGDSSKVDSTSTRGSYQMRSESQIPNVNKSSGKSQSTNQSATNSSASASIDKYIQQAESYISQQLWASALKELRVAIQIDCNHSKCHALLGYVYLNQKLTGMAKVSFQQALKLNPEEPLALKYFSQVSGTSPIKDSQTKTKDDKDKKGGFFGWLGGG